MYFTEDQASTLFSQIRRSMCPRSHLWLDCASHDAVSDQASEPEVGAFIDSMRVIGEPFVRGFRGEKELAAAGFEVLEYVGAASVLGNPDPVMKHYSFAICAYQTDHALGG